MRGPATLTGVPAPRSVLTSIWRTAALSLYLGWQDVRMMYRRSVLGQFWITISMIVTFAAIGTVFGFIFNSPIIEYLPYLGCGLVFFNFLSLLLNDGSMAFIAAEGFIRQLSLEPIVYFLRSVWKTVFVLLHNALALALLFAFFPQEFSAATLLVLPGLVVAAVGTSGLALALAMLATRYRDVPQIVSAVVQVLFYLTPIVWLPQALPAPVRDVILTWNPLNHMIAVMRQPLLGEAPSASTWGAALGLAAGFLVLGALAYVVKRRQLAFWV
jgi:lipopolysaccharide transport system permease protein